MINALLSWIHDNFFTLCDGLAATLNCLFAFASRGRGAQSLSLWIIASFMFSTTFEAITNIPLQTCILAAGDLALLVAFHSIWSKSEGVSGIRWPLTFLQLTAIGAHFINLAFRSKYHHDYFVVLDVLYYLTICVNFAVSVRNGFSLADILPFRRIHIHSRAHILRSR